jgi:hypothetical protein
MPAYYYHCGGVSERWGAEAQLKAAHCLWMLANGKKWDAWLGAIDLRAAA